MDSSSQSDLSAASEYYALAETDPGQVSVDSLLPLLESDSLKARVRTLRVLELVVSADPDTAPAVVTAISPLLSDEKTPARKVACELLYTVALTHPTALVPLRDELVDRLDDHDAIRSQVVRIFNAIAEHEPDELGPIVDELVVFLDDDRLTGQDVYATLVEIGYDFRAATDRSEDAAIRRGGLHSLWFQVDNEHSSPPEAVAELLPFLDDEDTTVRETAFDVLSNLAQAHPDAVVPHLDAVTRHLDDEHVAVRRRALRIITWVQKSHLEAVHSIVDDIFPRVSDDDQEVLDSAVHLLTQLGFTSRNDAVELFSADTVEARRQGIRAFTHMAEGGCYHIRPDDLDAVRPLLDDEDETVRRCACTAIGTVGRQYTYEVRPYLGDLRPRLEDEQSVVRFEAVRTLQRVGNQSRQSIEPFGAELRELSTTDETPAVREAAAEVLSTLDDVEASTDQMKSDWMVPPPEDDV